MTRQLSVYAVTRPTNRLTTDETDDWRTRALCRGADPEAWFSDDVGTQDMAKAICAVCPSRAECLDDALSMEGAVKASGRFGIRGGLDPTERASVVRRGRRAAPPPPQGPQPIEHGTERGYRMHRRRSEQPCDSCTKAANLARRTREDAR